MVESTRTAIISDIHYPYHDPHAVELAVRVIGIWQPDTIIINGDGVDFYAVSAYDRDPSQLREGGLQQEIDLLVGLFREINRVKKAAAKVKYTVGNHEDRLRRYLWRHPELADLEALKLQNLLRLEENGVEFADEEVELANGNLIVKHGSFVRKWGGLSAMAELENERFDCSTISGHTHRIGFTMVRTRSHLIGGWEGGCLCKLNPEYIKRPNWQHGMLLVTESTKGDHFYVSPVPFVNSGPNIKAFVNDQEVRL